jgi:glycosyltransferase involved in cell wall biosynthesis
MKLSVIVPVYNEEQTIGAVIDRIRAVNLGSIEKEIIVANDGSSDGTRRAIDEGPWRNDPGVCVLHSPINLGKGAAVRLGLQYATGDVLLTQDADLELNRRSTASCSPRSSTTAHWWCTDRVFFNRTARSLGARALRTACSRCSRTFCLAAV